MSSVLSNSLSIIREKAATRRIDLELIASPDLGSIQADPRKVKQMLYNLLSNAVKFSAEGGRITVRVSRVPREEVGKLSGTWAGRSTSLPESVFTEFLAISVTDGGIGISADGARSAVQTVLADRQRPLEKVRGYRTWARHGQAAHRTALRSGGGRERTSATAPASQSGCRAAREIWRRSCQERVPSFEPPASRRQIVSPSWWRTMCEPPI